MVGAFALSRHISARNCFDVCRFSGIPRSLRPDWEGRNRFGGGHNIGRITEMRFGETMLSLDKMSTNFRTVYVFVLITIWVGAMLANIATIAGLNVEITGLIGVSVFIGAMIVRSYTTMQR